MGVELDRSDLTGADLRGANFETAQMSRNDLHGTLVDSQTTWPDPKWELCWSIVNLGAEGRDLMGSDLSWTYLDKTNLREANLHGANLTGAHFGFADMRGVDLSEANLDSASLDKADLTGADLSGANLNAATLFYTDLTGADLTGTILTHVILNGTNLEKAEYDRYTVWPPTLDPDQLGAIRVDWRSVICLQNLYLCVTFAENSWSYTCARG
jgi:uncharacterized protein YjbI with pentapeptide repeats